MIKDRNKGITQITYNHLNLPKEIKFANNNKIEYLYTATGEKVRKKVTEGNQTQTTEYLEGFQYVDGELSFFPTAEGYVKVTLSRDNDLVFTYVYNYTDHLGNIRLRYTRNPLNPSNIRILEEDHYYPFGMKHKGYNNEHNIIVPPHTPIPIHPTVIIPITPDLAEEYKYKYNGKELQDELGLNFYDYGARNYDPALGRWMSVDPLAEKYSGISPYGYCANNPIVNKEIDGRYFIFIPGLGYSTQLGYINSPYVSAYGHMVDEFDRNRGGLGGATISGSRGGNSSLGNRFHDGLYVLWWGSKIRGNIQNDYRAMNIVNHVVDNYSRVREAGDNFDVISTSQGTVSAAQAMIAMLSNPVDFGLPEDFHLDNVYLAGSMIDPNSKPGQLLQSFADNGKIGNLNYISAPGDTIEGTGSTSRGDAFRNATKFIKMISGELQASSDAKKQGATYTPIHPHIRAAENLPNNPLSGCSTSACEVRQVIQSTYKE